MCVRENLTIGLQATIDEKTHTKVMLSMIEECRRTSQAFDEPGELVTFIEQTNDFYIMRILTVKLTLTVII